MLYSRIDIGYSPSGMLVEERHQLMLTHLRSSQALTVEQAAGLCGVSADTVRRDFRKLAARGLARRTHGGIVLTESYAPDTSNLDRRGLYHAEKVRIAEATARLIQPGETLAIDAGTTVIEMIPHLAAIPDLTVVTYGLDVARAAVDSSGMSCIMLGGVIRGKTYSAVGPDTLGMLERFQITTFVLGANAVSVSLGIMTPNRMEAEVKRRLVEISQRVILAADSSKIERRALVSFCDFSNIDTFVTDEGAEPGVVKAMIGRGVTVLTV